MRGFFSYICFRESDMSAGSVFRTSVTACFQEKPIPIIEEHEETYQ